MTSNFLGFDTSTSVPTNHVVKTAIHFFLFMENENQEDFDFVFLAGSLLFIAVFTIYTPMLDTSGQH